MSTHGIFNIEAYEILDSRGNPTIYCRVSTQGGFTGWSAVPSGASTGRHEAHELRDNDITRYKGKGVQHAVYNITHTILPELRGKSILDQKDIDQALIDLDGTENKSRLGGNAILAVSLAVSRCASSYVHKPLYLYLRTTYWPNLSDWTIPTPLLNILNGGKHATGSFDMQEFMVIPGGATSFAEAMRWGTDVYRSLYSILKSQGYSLGVGDEGGFMPMLSSHREALDMLVQAIKNSGYKPKTHISIGLDPASSEFYTDGKYYLSIEKEFLSTDDLYALYRAWLTRYPILSIEDPFAEDDWEGFQKITHYYGDSIQIVGDDLYATNPKRIKKGIENKATNAVLIKVNQIGTLSETVEAINLARENNQQPIISHRSGDTEDTFIADFAIASGVSQIKSGAPTRTERVAKYNRLMVIEREFNGESSYVQFPNI